MSIYKITKFNLNSLSVCSLLFNSYNWSWFVIGNTVSKPTPIENWSAKVTADVCPALFKNLSNAKWIAFIVECIAAVTIFNFSKWSNNKIFEVWKEK